MSKTTKPAWTAEQKRRDTEKYSESIFYSARYSGELTFAPSSRPAGEN